MNTENAVELVSDHFQVLFGDGVQAPHIDTTTLWDASGRIASLEEFPELVGLGTIRYGGVTRLTIRVNEFQDIPAPDWRELGGFEVNVPSGRLIFWAPELENIALAPGFDLPPGLYEGRAFSRGEEGVHDEMASEGPDEYLIVLSRLKAGRDM